MKGWVSNEAELSNHLRGRRCTGAYCVFPLTFPLRLVSFKLKVADQ